MILSRLRYRPVTVPLPSRYSFWASVTERYRFYTNVTQGYPALWTVKQALASATY
jgi:hypothetical protein